MPFIPVPNGVRVCLRFAKAGQQVCNVFYVDAHGAITLTTLNQVGSIFKTWWNTYMQPITGSDTSLQAIEVVDASESGGIGIEYTTGLPLTGASSGSALPNNVTVASKLTTGRTGRSYRGRSYFNGLTDTNLQADQQHITTTMQGVLDAAFDQLISALISQTLNLAVASLYSGVDVNHKPIPRSSGVLTDIIGASTNLTLDSQRRRLPERGS